VSGGLVFAAISAGTQHSCGLTTSQVVYCWGLNNHGQLGSGTFSGSGTPVRVASQP
jgi:alpha-tubulin suppressor-like RCC1 family protein